MPDQSSPVRDRLRRLGSFSASAALILAVSFAIAWPIWSFATGARKAFTIAIGAAIILAAAGLIARAARKRSR